MSKLKEWVKNNYNEEALKDILKNGCIGGITGLTYYNETSEIYEIFKDDIWDLIKSGAEENDVSVVSFIADFIPYTDLISNDETFKNTLVWFAVEEVAMHLREEYLIDAFEE